MGTFLTKLFKKEGEGGIRKIELVNLMKFTLYASVEISQ
jgi:hypothetical protein